MWPNGHQRLINSPFFHMLIVRFDVTIVHERWWMWVNTAVTNASNKFLEPSRLIFSISRLTCVVEASTEIVVTKNCHPTRQKLKYEAKGQRNQQQLIFQHIASSPSKSFILFLLFFYWLVTSTLFVFACQHHFAACEITKVLTRNIPYLPHHDNPTFHIVWLNVAH